jgi:hypothetical protein
MAVTTFDRATSYDAPAKGKGFARRLYDRYVEAQMKRAQLRVNSYLQTLDDAALADLGYGPAQIAEIRRADAGIPLIV